MSKDQQSDQAALFAGIRQMTTDKIESEKRNVNVQIAGIAVAVFIALFSVLYVTTAEPPLPEYEITLLCDKTPKTRTVIIGAKSAKDALEAVKTQLPGCGIAPKKTAATQSAVPDAAITDAEGAGAEAAAE